MGQVCKEDIKLGFEMGGLAGLTVGMGNPVAGGIGALIGGAFAARNGSSCNTSVTVCVAQI